MKPKEYDCVHHVFPDAVTKHGAYPAFEDKGPRPSSWMQPWNTECVNSASTNRIGVTVSVSGTYNAASLLFGRYGLEQFYRTSQHSVYLYIHEMPPMVVYLVQQPTIQQPTIQLP
jgi:hypothetical protein